MFRSSRLAPLAIAIALLAACASTLEATPMPTPMATEQNLSVSPSASATVTAPPSASPTTTAASATASPSHEPTDPLLAVELTDVRTGDVFTLAQLAADEGPVLLEPMAIWCSSCRAQQHEVVGAHAIGDFTSVSLDVDLSEAPEDLAAYADREGWDWRFAMADADLYRLLQERFGFNATHPPSTPLIVVEADGTVRPLEFGAGIRSAEQLVAEIGA
jgi:hypothetical protein